MLRWHIASALPYKRLMRLMLEPPVASLVGVRQAGHSLAGAGKRTTGDPTCVVQ